MIRTYKLYQGHSQSAVWITGGRRHVLACADGLRDIFKVASSNGALRGRQLVNGKLRISSTKRKGFVQFVIYPTSGFVEYPYKKEIVDLIASWPQIAALNRLIKRRRHCTQSYCVWMKVTKLK